MFEGNLCSDLCFSHGNKPKQTLVVTQNLPHVSNQPNSLILPQNMASRRSVELLTLDVANCGQQPNMSEVSSSFVFWYVGGAGISPLNCNSSHEENYDFQLILKQFGVMHVNSLSL